MAAKVGQVVIDFVTNLAKFETDMKKASRSFRNLGNELSSAGKTLTLGVTAPLVGLGAAAVKLAGDFEQTKIAFTTMLGSAQKSTAFLKELEAFAARTPFEFSELTEASKRMMALGFSADQVIPTMTAVGNAVAALGGGGELINRVTLALGQMQAKGKVSAEEMRQLAEAGIPAWQMLADKIGVSVPEAMEMAKKGTISASEAIPAILAGMTEKFGGLMETQSKTLLGQVSNMKDQFFFMLRDFGTALLPAATAVLEALKPIIAFVGDLAKQFAALPAPMQTTIVAFTAIAAAIGPVLMVLGSIATGISTLLPLLGGFAAALSGPVGITVALVAIGAALAAWAMKNEEVRAAVGAAWTWLKDTAISIFNGIKDLVATVTQAIAAIWQTHGDWIKMNVAAMWENVKLIFGSAFDIVKNIVSGAWTAIKAIFEGAMQVIKGLVQVFQGVLTGDFSKMGEGLKNIVTGMWTAIKGIFKGAIDAVIGTVKDLYERVTGYFKNMFDKVVGHSYVPDMINGIQTQFARLPEVMVRPALAATSAVMNSFAVMEDQIAGPGGHVPDMTEDIEGRFGTFDDIMWLPSDLATAGVTGEFGAMNSDITGTILPVMMGGIRGGFGSLDSIMVKPTQFSVQGVIDSFQNMVSTVTNMIRNWKDTLWSLFSDIGSGILNSLMGGGGLWDGIKRGLGGFLGKIPGLGNIFGGQGGGGTLNTLMGGPGGLLGGGGWMGTSGEFVGPVQMSGGGGGMFGGFGSLTKMLTTAGKGLWSGISGLGSLLSKGIGFLASNPIGWLAAGGLGAFFGGKALANWAKGPNSYEAGSEEVMRDFGLKMSDKQVKALFGEMGVSESKAWGIRKDLLSSPQGLQAMYMLAEEQGKTSAFLSSLGRVSGQGGKLYNFRNAFETGLETGVWDDLNAVFKTFASESKNFIKSGQDLTKFFAENAPTEMAATTAEDIIAGTDTASTERATKMEEHLAQMELDLQAQRKLAEEVASREIVGTLTIDLNGPSDLVTWMKEKIIPIIKLEMTGGNTGLRETVRRANATTEGAY